VNLVRRWCAVVLVSCAWSALGQAPLGLDLSESSEVKSVLVLPPVVRVSAAQGGFVGFNSKKTSERFDVAAHKRLVAAISLELAGKVLPVDATMGFLSRQSVVASQLKLAPVLASLATDTHVDWLVGFEFNKAGALVATVFNAGGVQAGELSTVSNAAGVPQKVADQMAMLVVKQLNAQAKLKAAADAAALLAVAPPPTSPPLPPPEDDVDAELSTVPTAKAWAPDPKRVRVVVSVGPGAALRGLELSGDGAASLAELRNNGVVGLGVYAQVKPLELLDATAGRRISDLAIELHYRRAFVRARGVEGAVAGQDCSMTDDDVQVRGSWRFRLGENPMLPSIGLGGGWSQESTKFACALPLVSTTWSGVDAQLRVRQPLYRDVLALDLAWGPRFLLSGADATRAGFSFSGEAWLELKPASVFFARGGARVSRLAAATDTLSVVDTRAFFALEFGAFL
jgi:hypothetical protein